MLSRDLFIAIWRKLNYCSIILSFSFNMLLLYPFIIQSRSYAPV